MTLVEMVLAVTIMGFIMSAIAMSLLVIVRSDKPTSERLTEAKDVAFLQTYLPVDYSSAISRDVTPTLQPISGETLPGTNVLTLYRQEGATSIITSYRYEQVGEDWQLARYEYGNPDSSIALTRTVVAHQLAEPPAGWTASDSPVHAVVVNARNQTLVRPVGDDMSLTFKSGNGFSTGGSGLASNSELSTDYSGGTSDPTVVRSRCGGRVTLLLDKSGSVDFAGAAQDVKDAALGFLSAFQGTPSDLAIVEFATTASMTYPSTGGTYFSVLDPSATDLNGATNGINALSFPPTNLTNWEEGIFRTYKASNGAQYALQPELVVFVTDGDPNVIMNPPWNWYYNWDPGASWRLTTATDNASIRANELRSGGARLVGIAVGSAANSSASLDRLKQVVGNTAWNGSVAPDGTIDIGNAANADYFVAPGGDFTKLGSVLRAVAAGQCGGTVTIRRRSTSGERSSIPAAPGCTPPRSASES
ncbi:MAG: vWA domain-containing protein [Ilumatobacteraceae bacterium]